MGVAQKLLIIFVIFFIATLVCGEPRVGKKIGILLFNDQPRYVQNKNGVIDQLKKHGFREPLVTFTVESANGNKVRAAEAARRFIDAKMDMVVTIGTTATVVAAAEIKNIPLVFVMVWDPVESMVAKAWKNSGNNVTGVSSKTSTSKLFSVLKGLAPIKKVAVLYTAGERNTEIQLKEFQAEKDNFNIQIVPVSLSSNEELSHILPYLTSQVHAICLTGSSIVGDNLPWIVHIATKAKVITASQSEDLVELGALVGITVDPYAVGLLAGKKAVQVLKGAKPSSIPIETLKKQDVMLNLMTAKDGGFQIPSDFMKKVTKTIE